MFERYIKSIRAIADIPDDQIRQDGKHHKTEVIQDRGVFYSGGGSASEDGFSMDSPLNGLVRSGGASKTVGIMKIPQPL
ncbi:hypothetical protein [Desmospora profundinema]|uniref:Uncharacterized protein n=1 Tax=Desmospora profundinema TaxID=1571184 RepID=A0ABU1ILF6_9BACL|nr:hypothetical protein [Desmospora profundinema]MDR6224620.1 hypothetical protein [Desmospora profundinema]